MKVTTAQIPDYIISCIKANLVPMISGDPGIGKSDIARQIAEKYKLNLIDIRLSQCDPTDLNGFPNIKEGIATYTPMDIFPLENSVIPKGYTGSLIFLDEFNSATLAVQAASYKLILDRTVGQHKLHPKAAIICAGNKMGNNAIVNRMSTAMQSRLIHFDLAVDALQWIDWATINKLDHRIISYIHGRPDNLHNFDPAHNDMTFACPRTWAFASRLILNNNGTLRDKLPLLAGTISEAVAREFLLYTEYYSNLPTFKDILIAPGTITIDNEPIMLYAVSHMIATYANNLNIDKLMFYISRLPVEFATITLQTIIKRDRTMIKEKAIRNWMDIKGALIF